jgi:chromosome segregation ATPase|mmetsp:Transcript_24290/g.43922  ORF Transcript_24290/g.43922 Transcript_24290/m.43922 type:complete len:86 (-) Transcript_24290:405-662(-)
METQEAAKLKFQTEASFLRESMQSLDIALAEKEKEFHENISKAEELENLLDACKSKNDLREAEVLDLKASVEDLEHQLKVKDTKF